MQPGERSDQQWLPLVAPFLQGFYSPPTKMPSTERRCAVPTRRPMQVVHHICTFNRCRPPCPFRFCCTREKASPPCFLPCFKVVSQGRAMPAARTSQTSHSFPPRHCRDQPPLARCPRPLCCDLRKSTWLSHPPCFPTHCPPAALIRITVD